MPVVVSIARRSAQNMGTTATPKFTSLATIASFVIVHNCMTTQTPNPIQTRAAYNHNYYIEVRFLMACVFGEMRTLATGSW